MFDRRGRSSRYTSQQTLHWLAWLAHALTVRAQTIFYLDNLQPDWPPARAGKLEYPLVDRVAFGLASGLLVGLAIGVLHGPGTGAVGGLLLALMVGLLGGAMRVACRCAPCPAANGCTASG